MSNAELIERLRTAVEALPAGLRDHILRVESEASRLADRYGIDPERARIAVLGHDLARSERGPRLLEMAAVYEVTVDDIETASPILLHGRIAARMLTREYGYEDGEVLEAVAAHTTARPGMSVLQKLLFIADKIEPEKVKQKPKLAEVRHLADTSLDAAMLRFLDLHLLEAVERQWHVHPDSVAARNELLAGQSTGRR